MYFSNSFLLNRKNSILKNIYKVLAEKIKEVNSVMPKYKAIRGILVSEEPLVKTTTGKIKRQANIELIEEE